MSSTRTQCKACLMDISASEIVFTDTGCNFCDQARNSLRQVEYDRTLQPTRIHILEKLQVTEGTYNCLIGLSGGVDSSYTLYQAVKMGLRPLCFSVDNGWNDPKADENIMKLVEGMKVPFYRYVIDLKKFKELQSAFLKAGVKNVEIPTDHILMAVSYELANNYGIKTILSGGNVATESIMPPSWGYSARDLVHIKDIYNKMTGKKLTGLPTCSLFKFNWYKWVKKIKTVYLLDYMTYNREEAIKVLEKAHGYKHPGEKHCESIWTSWFQNYYLFEKFGIDKRKAHLSSLIVSGQITRKDALEVINENPVYPELGIEKKIMKYPKHEHSEYKTDEWLFNFIGSIIKKLR